MQTAKPYRLLIVRLGSMGDILHALPAVTALRWAHPEWHIDWAVEPQWRALLAAEGDHGGRGNHERCAARPVVDDIYLVPVKAWGRNPLSTTTWGEIRELRQRLRACSYDAVLDLQGSVRSALIGRLSGCKRILGESEPREALARRLYTERVETLGVHVIEQDMELAGAVAGDQLGIGPPALPVDLDAEDWCNGLLRLYSWHPRTTLVLVHPGAGWGAKRWPANRFGAVVEELAQRGATVLVNAGPGEQALAESVVAAAGGMGSVVTSTLTQLISLTRRATLVIGGDTGPLHLACALGRPVVGIYGPTDTRRNGPFGSHFQVLRNPESRTDHTRREQPEAGLLTITPDDVMTAAAQVIIDARHSAAQTEDYGGGDPLRERRATGPHPREIEGRFWEARRG